MSDTPRIGPKLYEDANDDPAKIAEDKAKADYDARLAATKSRDVDPDKIPSSPRDYGALAKAMTKAEPTPQRGDLQKEADQLAERLARNPAPYVGKKEDQARLAELQKKLSSTPDPNLIAFPKTNDASRDAKDGLLVTRSGHDGPSVYAGVTGYQKTDGTTRIQVANRSAQIGVATELEATTVRITDTDASRTVTLEGPAVKGAVGLGRNDDGSLGYHNGVSIAVASAQVTKNLDNGGSVTLGLSEGIGAGLSVGAKTTEKGETAASVQVSALFFTVGACLPVRY